MQLEEAGSSGRHHAQAEFSGLTYGGTSSQKIGHSISDRRSEQNDNIKYIFTHLDTMKFLLTVLADHASCAEQTLTVSTILTSK